MVRFFGVLLALLAIGVAVWATAYRDATSPPRFETEEFASGGLQSAAERIAAATMEGGAPGVVLMIRRGGADALAAAGVADKKSRRPMSPNSRLRVGSVSKVYTASAALAAADAGALDLDALISEYLPADVLEGLPNGDAITARQLLMHTSGVPDYYDIRSYFLQDWREPITLERMLPVAKRGTATGAPGERFAYSNMGYVLLGAVVEAAAGAPLGDLIEASVVDPLGLNATTYNVKHPEDPGVHGYGTLLRPWADTYDYWEHSGPDAGVMASAADVVDFLDALALADDGPLAAIGVQMMAETVEAGGRQTQGMGLHRIDTRSGKVLVGHSGDVFGFQTFAYALPEEDAVIFGHVNCDCDALLASMIGNALRAVDGARRAE